MKKHYVGFTKVPSVSYKVLRYFSSEYEPTEESHGDRYSTVIGPFRTKRGAKFMEAHGSLNPHVQHVNDAERIAKQINFTY